jgi:hypothetical protein
MPLHEPLEPLDKGEGGFGDFAPTMVNGEGVTTVLDLYDFSDAVVVLLLFLGGLDDGRRHGMVHLARNNQDAAWPPCRSRSRLR